MSFLQIPVLNPLTVRSFALIIIHLEKYREKCSGLQTNEERDATEIYLREKSDTNSLGSSCYNN